MPQPQFIIEGGHRLKGEITPQGAKNEALQILCATLLTDEKVVVRNIPVIEDVLRLIDLLGCLGVTVEKIDEHTYSFRAAEINTDYLHTDDFVKKSGALRGSIMLAGALLARLGYAYVAQPGGDKIGRRKLDTHFIGFEKLGASVTYEPRSACYIVKAPADGLKGSYILLDEASVTGTANILMAACAAQGKTTIFNAACEPYLLQLSLMLQRMGARIKGIGSNLLEIEGCAFMGCGGGSGGSVTGAGGGIVGSGSIEHTLLPDMIEVGSFIGLAATTRSELTVKNVYPEHLGIIPEIFKRLGVYMEWHGGHDIVTSGGTDAWKERREVIADLHIPAQEHYKIEKSMTGGILTISDSPWPGFTPDLISVALVTATQAKGSVLIHQKMFESRLFFVDNLITMGAEIILCDPHRATVIGLNHEMPLRGISMVSPDIRAGVSLLIAALSAEGTSKIQNINQIDRGYENIEGRLNALGAKIERK
ncbi:MAG: UDP-N-acetylglucosamine 1-carboxyvinyltransferase [Bacteroidales bacterium]|jgi:UDP-N-acetylglucosamine 1-carboxyvinyltransferase|nr:UDP-N-acetylglucosamine 1-carboxyvinyltransferase [Bacteroidales bacterium]